MRSQNVIAIKKTINVKITISYEWESAQVCEDLYYKNLKREFIKSSSSSVKYSVIFILKKDRTKQLCVNY